MQCLLCKRERTVQVHKCYSDIFVHRFREKNLTKDRHTFGLPIVNFVEKYREGRGWGFHVVGFH